MLMVSIEIISNSHFLPYIWNTTVGAYRKISPPKLFEKEILGGRISR